MKLRLIQPFSTLNIQDPSCILATSKGRSRSACVTSNCFRIAAISLEDRLETRTKPSTTLTSFRDRLSHTVQHLSLTQQSRMMMRIIAFVCFIGCALGFSPLGHTVTRTGMYVTIDSLIHTCNTKQHSTAPQHDSCCWLWYGVYKGIIKSIT